MAFIRIFLNFVFIDLHYFCTISDRQLQPSLDRLEAKEQAKETKKKTTSFPFFSTRDYIQDLAKEFLHPINLSVCPMYRMKQKREVVTYLSTIYSIIKDAF